MFYGSKVIPFASRSLVILAAACTVHGSAGTKEMQRYKSQPGSKLGRNALCVQCHCVQTGFVFGGGDKTGSWLVHPVCCIPTKALMESTILCLSTRKQVQLSSVGLTLRNVCRGLRPQAATRPESEAPIDTFIRPAAEREDCKYRTPSLPLGLQS